MESMNHCLYSDLINHHQDIQVKGSESENQVKVNLNPSIQDTNPIDNNHEEEEEEEEEKEDSKSLRWNLNPIPSSFSIECNQRNRNPQSVLEIISPKSTTTQFDSKPDPFEFFGQQRSQFIQRDLKSSQSNLMVEEAAAAPPQVQDILQVDQTPKMIKHEYDQINLSVPNLYDPINHQLDDLTQSFQSSTKLFHSDLTPIQSFKKFKPLRLHSRLMNQSTNPNEIPRSFFTSTQDISLKATDEMMHEFLSPSCSIEEENQKVKILISKELQLSSTVLPPVLSIKGEPISNSIKSNPFTPLLSRKRKPSDLLDESDYHHSSRIRISHHSKHLKLMNSSGNLSVPSLAELRATMPASSRRYYHPIPSLTKQS